MLEIGTEKSSLWLATQSVIRTSRHLPISHLELAVSRSQQVHYSHTPSPSTSRTECNEPTYILVPIDLDIFLLKRIHVATKEFSGF